LETVLHCDCGFEVRAEDEGDLVAQVRRHAREAHGMALTPQQALLLAFRAELGEAAWPPRLASKAADDASPQDIWNRKEQR
jgi:hypothetical protein